MKNLEQNINVFEKELKDALKKAKNKEQLEKVRVAFLGRHGKIVELMGQLKDLNTEKKRIFGPKLNKLKKESETNYKKRKKSLDQELKKLEI